MKFWILALAFISVKPHLYAFELKAAVVSIFVISNSGEAGVGTGFFISADGVVATCYHVIQNAQRVEVFADGEKYDDIDVSAISTEHDLALLKVRGLRQKVSFLELSEETPLSFKDSTLETYGHPSILQSQYIRVRPTSDRFLQSQEFRASSGARLFLLKNVDLISLDMTIYNGISGAPLVYKNRAVGIISGSFQQGGSIAWAIPSKYLKDVSYINKPLTEIKPWPTLKLMSDTWKSLRKQANLGFGLATALRRYETLSDAYTDDIETLTNKVREWKPGIIEANRILDNQIRERGDQYVVEDDPDLQKQLDDFADGGDDSDAIEETTSKFEDDELDLQNALIVLINEVSAYFKSLPKTEKNNEIYNKVLRRLHAVDKTFDNLQAKARSTAKKGAPQRKRSEYRECDEVSVIHGCIKRLVSLGDYKNEFSEWLQIAEFCDSSLAQEMLQQFKSVQDIFENILEAEPDITPRSSKSR